jgi:thioredoxin-related protein
MAREVYTDKEFIRFSRSQVFMRVFQDTDPEGERLARKFRIDGVPTLIVLDSDGREVDRLLGAMSAPELIDELTFIFEGAKKPRYSI